MHGSPELGLGPRLQSMEHLRITSFDLCRPGVDVHGDLELLPFKTATFDLVISSHVLEHVEDDRRAMREVSRVLDPRAGTALVLVPVDTNRESTFEDWSITTPEARAAAFGQSDHVRQYGQDVRERLAESGLEVTAIDFVQWLDDGEASLIRAQPGIDLIYECRRPGVESGDRNHHSDSQGS